MFLFISMYKHTVIYIYTYIAVQYNIVLLQPTTANQATWGIRFVLFQTQNVHYHFMVLYRMEIESNLVGGFSSSRTWWKCWYLKMEAASCCWLDDIVNQSIGTIFCTTFPGHVTSQYCLMWYSKYIRGMDGYGLKTDLPHWWWSAISDDYMSVNNRIISTNMMASLSWLNVKSQRYPAQIYHQVWNHMIPMSLIVSLWWPLISQCLLVKLLLNLPTSYIEFCM